ncbi:MAG: magnesium transporter CorA family protein [Bacteroidota bacterium]
MLKRYELSNNALIESQSVDSPVVVYINPSASERSTLISEFQLDEHTLSSALDPDELSRVEFGPDRVLVIWKRPMNYSGEDNFFFNVTSAGLFLIGNRLVFVASEELLLQEALGRQRYRASSSLDLLLIFLYYTIHHYLEHLKVMKLISRDLHEKIYRSMENEHLIQMFNLSESLVYYANAINSNNTVLSRLRAGADKLNLAPQTIEFLDDMIIENNQCYKQTEIYSSVFAGLMDARGNLVNNNMTVLLKNLTIINIIFLPLNLLASMGGMSEFTMMTKHIDWRVSYSLFVMAMIVIGFLTHSVLRRMGFLSNQPVRKARRKRRWFSATPHKRH